VGKGRRQVLRALVSGRAVEKYAAHMMETLLPPVTVTVPAIKRYYSCRKSTSSSNRPHDGDPLAASAAKEPWHRQKRPVKQP
jgi:hypothetical protein